ncbi:hypothetical protein BJ741DRAFT_20842 [Chytriomyces cf. hyalinus JEL632]|nr:hypothetical protein BJ741DRAFT_20842 [Chytriomyces cf. hyalinus JEL632]
MGHTHQAQCLRRWLFFASRFRLRLVQSPLTHSATKLHLITLSMPVGTEIQSQPLEDLAKAFEEMIAKVPKGSRFEIAKTVSEYVSDFLNRPIKGIADDNTRKSLVTASENVILCLTDAAILFTEYMDKPGTTLSDINKKKLDDMKKRLADVQDAHKSAKDEGLFTILTTVASDVVDIKRVGQDTNDVAHRVESHVVDSKEAVYKVARHVENIDATLQAQAKKSEEDKLKQLCQNRVPHSGEVLTSVNRCPEDGLLTKYWIPLKMGASRLPGCGVKRERANRSFQDCWPRN